MIPTPTEEIRAIRHELAGRFDNDLNRIVTDLRRQQQESGLKYIKLPKRSAVARERGGQVPLFGLKGQGRDSPGKRAQRVPPGAVTMQSHG